MGKQRWTVLLAVSVLSWLVACSEASDGDAANGSSAGGSSTGSGGSSGSTSDSGGTGGSVGGSGGATANAGAAGEVGSAGQAGSSGSAGMSGGLFASCTEDPFTMGGSSCSDQETRVALGCGMAGSQLDGDCCLRSVCTDDSDCAVGGRCVPRSLQGPQACWGSNIESCEPSSSGCGCVVTSNCDFRAYCIEADEPQQAFECPVADQSCDALEGWLQMLQTLTNWREEHGEPLSPALAARSSDCVTQIEAKLAADCD